MNLPKLYTYYTLKLTALLLLGLIACKDFEDCRNTYTNVVYIEFRNYLSIDRIDFVKPCNCPLYTSTTQDDAGKQTLRDLKKLPIPLHPKNDMVSLLFYKTPADPAPDTLTIFYTRTASLHSPSCGVQQAYILDSLETSFAESTIIKPILRSTEYEKENPEEVKNPNVKIRY